MGCDGGTIPRRDELVRVAKKPEQKDKESELAYRWRHCAITQQPLQEPIVMCGLGRLYSKQNVIECLLEKDKMPDAAKHIRSLRDIRQLSMSRNPAYEVGRNQADGGLDVRSAPFICKLIGLEMTGRFRFVALWSCGCVFSERALKECCTANLCSLCQQPFTDEDIITLNGDDEAVERMLVKIQTRAAKLHAAKKDKKAAKKKTTAAAAASSASDAAEATIKSEPAEAKVKTDRSESDTPKPGTSATVPVIGAAAAAPAAGPSSSSKPPANLKRAIPAGTGKPRTAAQTKDNVMADPELKRLKADGDFSVASDPKASDVYKSLFTSHHTEQEQTRAHWVTYNPFYN